MIGAATPWVPSPYQQTPEFIARIRNLQAPASSLLKVVASKESVQALDGELFESLSRSAQWISLLSMHLSAQWRANVLGQFQRLLSLEHWDDDCNLLDEASTRTFLRFVIFGEIERFPMLGISNKKRLTASWLWGKDRRLNIEFAETDRCRMVFSYPGEFEVVRQAMDGNIGDAAKVLTSHGFDFKSVAPQMPVAVDDAHHVARYCSHQKLIPSDPLSVSPVAFQLRQGETYLSVNHCEHHAGTLLKQLRAILADLAAKGFTTRPAGGLAVLNAGRIVECGDRRDRNLRVRRRHDDKDQSYASIDGMPEDNTDAELLDLLALDATIGVHKVADIP